MSLEWKCHNIVLNSSLFFIGVEQCPVDTHICTYVCMCVCLWQAPTTAIDKKPSSSFSFLASLSRIPLMADIGQYADPHYLTPKIDPG